MRARIRSAVSAVPFAVVVLTGCATAPGDYQPRGSSGPVAWEVVDVRQRVAPDRREVRWYYTIVVKETAGRAIAFEREQLRGGGGPESLPTDRPLRLQLKANSELRLYRTYRIYDIRRWPPATVSVFYRYSGRDDAGTPVTVDAHVPIGLEVGRVMPQPMPTSPLPPARRIEPQDLKTLAEKWRGHTRDQAGFDIPLAVAIKEDGAFEATEDEPVTYRFRGTLTAREGTLAFATRTDIGTLTLYEGGGLRVLQGYVTGRREGLPDRPGAAPYTVTYLIYLESKVPPP